MLVKNLIASHLLKAVSFWNETGLGNFGLHYIRDKEKREVDFLISRDDKAWILIESKLSDVEVSKNLKYFHNLIKTNFSFQIVKNLNSINRSCFDSDGISIVPAISFLSQLV